MRDEFLNFRKRWMKTPAERRGGKRWKETTRELLASAMRAALPAACDALDVQAGIGQGVEAKVPWVGILDPDVAPSAQCGYYPVYLFSTDLARVYLCMIQGTAALMRNVQIRNKERRQRGRNEELERGEVSKILRRRADIMCRELQGWNDDFSRSPVDLVARTKLVRSYRHGVVFSRSYKMEALPSEAEMRAHLASMIGLYTTASAMMGAEIRAPKHGDDDGDPPPRNSRRRRRRAPPAPKLGYIRYLKSRETTIEPQHDRLQKKFEDCLLQTMPGVVLIDPPPGCVDLCYSEPQNELVFVEVKPCDRLTARFAIRTALGQLLDYEDDSPASPPSALLIVIGSKPDEHDIGLAHRHGVGVAYPSGNEFKVCWRPDQQDRRLWGSPQDLDFRMATSKR